MSCEVVLRTTTLTGVTFDLPTNDWTGFSFVSEMSSPSPVMCCVVIGAGGGVAAWHPESMASDAAASRAAVAMVSGVRKI
jgi:hypothetical protein